MIQTQPRRGTTTGGCCPPLGLSKELTAEQWRNIRDRHHASIALVHGNWPLMLPVFFAMAGEHLVIPLPGDCTAVEAALDNPRTSLLVSDGGAQGMDWQGASFEGVLEELETPDDRMEAWRVLADKYGPTLWKDLVAAGSRLFRLDVETLRPVRAAQAVMR